MRRSWLLFGSVALAFYVLWLARTVPSWPEDWDGVGFVRSVSQFSLERFTPHPPGYPVYVAFLRAVAALGVSPLGAAQIVSVASGAATACLVAAPRRRLAALLFAGAAATTPLSVRAFTVVGTEGLALAILAAAVLYLQSARDRAPLVVGIACGLGLGVRLSWAPLFLGVAIVAARRARGRREVLAVLLGLVVATLVWAVPLLVVTGPTKLVHLYATQLGGHATRWGGTALIEPSRVRYLVRDVLVDGLGVERDPLGLCIAVCIAALAVRGAAVLRRRGIRGVSTTWCSLAWPLGAYLAWIAIGQNLREEPRHALPLVVAAAISLVAAGIAPLNARAADSSPSSRVPWGTALACAFVALSASRAGSDAILRRSIAPAGVQLVALAAHDPDALVFGARSARFFELEPELSSHARTAATLGDVLLDLGREPALPSRVLVTDEIEGGASSPYPLVHIVRLCRPPRLDRRRPCLEVSELRAPFLK